MSEGETNLKFKDYELFAINSILESAIPEQVRLNLTCCGHSPADIKQIVRMIPELLKITREEK